MVVVGGGGAGCARQRQIEEEGQSGRKQLDQLNVSVFCFLPQICEEEF